MHNREGLSPALIWEAIKELGSYPLYIIGVASSVLVRPQVPDNYALLTSLRYHQRLLKYTRPFLSVHCDSQARSRTCPAPCL